MPPITENDILKMDSQELQDFAQHLLAQCQTLGNRMLTKAEVAKHVGMTVSWLDNSKSDLARELRRSGVRYGSSQTSPVRFPLTRVVDCLRDYALTTDAERSVSK